MKISELLIAKLEKHFDKKIVEIHRLYPGIIQRGHGAFVWSATFEGGMQVGSQHTMKSCANANRLIQVATWPLEIVPDNKKD